MLMIHGITPTTLATFTEQKQPSHEAGIADA
jgi:hypothetical protein